MVHRRVPRKHPIRHRSCAVPLLLVIVLALGAWGVIEASRFVPVLPPQERTGDTPVPTTAQVGLAPLATLPALQPAVAAEEPTLTPDSSPPPVPPNLAETNPELAASFQHIIDTVSSGATTPGLVVLVDIPGQGRWIGAGGLANRAAQTPVQTGDRFRIASVTKMFIATVVLQLAQEDRLHLDDTVEQWLPGLVPGGQAITLRQLLNHTSGLYDYLDSGFEAIYFAQKPLRVWMPGELVAYGVSHPPYFAPGEPGRWKYSNTNYILLGMVIEKVTGTPLAQEVRARIFEPLGLTNSFFEESETIPGGFVHGYIGDEDYTHASLSTWAAGGIVSNAEDLSTFARALFGGKLLSDPMLREMLTWEDMSGNPVYGLGVARSIEGLSLATQGIVPTDMRFEEMWGHIGGLSGFKSVVGYEPQSGVVVVVLLNQMGTQVVPISIEAMRIAVDAAVP